MHCSKKIS